MKKRLLDFVMRASYYLARKKVRLVSAALGLAALWSFAGWALGKFFGFSLVVVSVILFFSYSAIAFWSYFLWFFLEEGPEPEPGAEEKIAA